MKKLYGMLFLFGAFTLAGTSAVAARLVIGKLGTFTITTISLFFALISLLPLAGRKMLSIKQLKAADWFYLAFQALFGIFLFRLFLLMGLRYTSTTEAGILTGATPAITSLLAGTILRERMSRRKWLGILCTITGIVIVQGLLLPGNKFALGHMLGNMLILCACASEALFNTCSRIVVVKAQARDRVPLHPMVQTFMVSAIAMLFCIIPACFEQPVLKLSLLGGKEWIALLWYGVFVTAVAFICWYAGIKRCPATTAAAFSGMMPFTSLLLSVLILREHAGLWQWFGGAFIILGMVMIGLSEE